MRKGGEKSHTCDEGGAQGDEDDAGGGEVGEVLFVVFFI